MAKNFVIDIFEGNLVSGTNQITLSDFVTTYDGIPLDYRKCTFDIRVRASDGGSGRFHTVYESELDIESFLKK